MRRLLPAFLILALGGCIPGFGGGGGSENDGLTRQFTLADPGIVVSGPSGYCLDQAASGPEDASAFAVFRRCEVLRGEDYPLPRRALLTVSVSEDAAEAPVVTGSEQRLIEFFATDAGKRALSRSGIGATVTVLQSAAQDGAVWLQVRDTSPAQQLDPTYWRVLFDLKGRIVTVTVASYADGPMPENRARRLAEEFVARLRAANAGGAVARAAGGAAEPVGKGSLSLSPRG